MSPLAVHARSARAKLRAVIAEIPWSDRRPGPRSLLIYAGISAVVAALCIVALDRPVARLIGEYQPIKLWDKSIELLEWTLGLPFFKFFSSAVLAAGMIVTSSVKRWRWQAPAWMVIAGTHILCRFATVRIKEATGRLRPTEWLAKGGDTFFRDGGIAFPSGHVMLFASILIPLAVVAPRTRPLLAIVLWVSVARIAVDAHYLSDAIAALTLVLLVTWGLAALARPLRTA
jgi:membrane-associated phospholipid phosphatase